MYVLLKLPVGLLDGLADLLLHVWVGRVVFDQCSEVLLLVAGGLSHEDTVLQLLHPCLDLLSQD